MKSKQEPKSIHLVSSLMIQEPHTQSVMSKAPFVCMFTASMHADHYCTCLTPINKDINVIKLLDAVLKDDSSSKHSLNIFHRKRGNRSTLITLIPIKLNKERAKRFPHCFHILFICTRP